MLYTRLKRNYSAPLKYTARNSRENRIVGKLAWWLERSFLVVIAVILRTSYKPYINQMLKYSAKLESGDFFCSVLCQNLTDPDTQFIEQRILRHRIQGSTCFLLSTPSFCSWCFPSSSKLLAHRSNCRRAYSSLSVELHSYAGRLGLLNFVFWKCTEWNLPF